MTRSGVASILRLVVLACACSPTSDAQTRRATPATDAGAFEEQVAEYIEKFPYQLTYDFTVRFTGRDPAKLNTWIPAGAPALVKAGNDVLPRTSHDTFNKGAALLLDDGPIVIGSSAPTTERFNSFELVDDRNANYRNIVYPKGKYTLYFGAKPERIEGEAIEVPSKLSVVIARVEVRDEDDRQDVASATAVFDGMTIAGARASEFPRLDLLSGYAVDVVAEANRRMDETAATVPFTQTIVGPGREPGRDVPFLYHASGTKLGWGGPDPSHSAYENIFFDANGREMKGSNGTYAVTTKEPSVDAFWSVTVYDHDRGGYLHPNARDRYHINNTSAVRNADGTVTFAFKTACAAPDPNCLEVPAGRFDLTIRYYLPHEEIVTGTWRFPQVELTTEQPAA